jgi:hypothetical protein
MTVWMMPASVSGLMSGSTLYDTVLLLKHRGGHRRRRVAVVAHVV